MQSRWVLLGLVAHVYAANECDNMVNFKRCDDAGQVCQDPDHTLNDTWVCKCQPPATSTELGGPVASCPYNECADRGTTCRSVGQTCTDTDLLTLDTWTCDCVAPLAGSGQQMAAVCTGASADCSAHGHLCTSAGQKCVDAVAGDGKITCECLEPAEGTPGQQQPAMCALNECLTTCPHCALTAIRGNICLGAEQMCYDPDHDPLSVSDWSCSCFAPQIGTQVVGVATCTMNECSATCMDCANTGSGNVCELAGQTCVDRNPSKASDWECHCVSPLVGFEVGKAVAQCEDNECVTREHVCLAAGQTCFDPDTTNTGDWQCRCSAPSTSAGEQGPAVCEADECVASAVPFTTCDAAGQTCVDPNKLALNNWECRCKTPGVGFKPLSPAPACALDECTVVCPACANTGSGNICELNNQVCFDVDPSAGSPGDWVCKCPPPSTVTAQTAAAPSCVAQHDECADGPSSAILECVHEPRYTDEGCLCKCNWESVFSCVGDGCVDPTGPGTIGNPCTGGCCNPDDDLYDWCYVAETDPYNMGKPECASLMYGYCTAAGLAPTDGGKTLRVAVPGIPASQNNVCTDVGQKCVDPDLSTRDDWVCECVLPLTGPLGQQAPAVCEDDECQVHAADCGVQICTDVDKATKDTWTCECASPSAPNPVQGGPTVCKLDECKLACPTCAVDMGGSNVCEAMGQTCVDTNDDSLSLGDWTCVCALPSTGTATGSVASCTLDECTTLCPTCADTGSGNICETKDQICEDPAKVPHTLSDWICTCKAPFANKQMAGTALCRQDECDAHKSECPAGQICVDADHAVTGTWVCECLGPFTGTQLNGPVAVCHRDECITGVVTCQVAGQECVDPNTAVDGDWECRCIAPDVGPPGLQAEAKCVPPDTCAEKWTVCAAGQQHCQNGAAPGTFMCECIAPAMGQSVMGGLAACDIDECLTVCATCQRTSAMSLPVCAQGQTCFDPDTRIASNWECQCTAPSTGPSATMQLATCELDECTADCPTCAKTMCTGAQQTCQEGSKAPLYVSDWHCACPAPSAVKARAAAAVCTYNECDDAANVKLCVDAGQVCVDPATTVMGDWECRCVSPESGSSKGSPATCALDECTAQCPGCANTGAGNVCRSSEGQKCVEPSKTTTGDWYCLCIFGQGLSVGSAVPACLLDECKDVCPTCAKASALAKDACANAGQKCTDPNPSALVLSDWTCRCLPPMDMLPSAVGTPTVCLLDECLTAGQACITAGQLCSDPSQSTLSDFVCTCPSGIGRHTAGPVAQCLTDECKAHSHECKDVSQTCRDPDMTKTGDWVCECPAPASGTKLGGVAVCEMDECQTAKNVCSQGQVCVDTDKAAEGDIECRCTAPATGKATNAPAVCGLDECVSTCAVCANGLCAMYNQNCVDPNPTLGSLGDWECVCPPPSTVRGIASSAICNVNECDFAGVVCQDSGSGQQCIDPNHDGASLNDWECHCPQPTTGFAIGKVAPLCLLDECAKHGHICTSLGQQCVDPDKDASKTGTWECRCVPPATQTAVAAPAQCNLDGECGAPTVSEVCTTVGQTCWDPSPALGDWVCECVSPSVGARVQGGRAQCNINECTADCATCAKGICSRANQVCVDTNTDAQTGLNTWECRCTAPTSGSKRLGRATCTTDECDIYGATCTAASQDCVDTDTTQPGNWVCTCRAPALGQATGMAAACVADECLIHGAVCVNAGQTCHDYNVAGSSLGDWVCRCKAPFKGETPRAPTAPCVVNECDLFGAVCVQAGQTCEDLDTKEFGNWACVCPNLMTRSTRAAAVCVFDECVEVGPATAVFSAGQDDVCKKSGQFCLDPNTSPQSVQDWRCYCTAPSSTAATAAPAAASTSAPSMGATTSAPAVRAKDGCGNDQRYTDKGCQCSCPWKVVVSGSNPPPFSGPGFDTDCTAGCCNPDGASTTWCMLADNEWNRDRPACAAMIRQKQDCADTRPIGAPSRAANVLGIHDIYAITATAVCAENECLTSMTLCPPDQVCFDTDWTAPQTFECWCVSPAMGTGIAKAAVCATDECAVHGHVCQAVSQVCEDSDTSRDDTWACKCPAGSPVMNSQIMAQADCAPPQKSECSIAAINLICAGAGQLCLDKDLSATNTWECACVEPAFGIATPLGPAICTLDECTEICATCAITTCTDRGQECVDLNTAAASRGDWECRCASPQSGRAAAAAATCVLDECAQVCKSCADTDDTGNLCIKNGQTCVDPNTDPHSTDDWECVCKPSHLGKASVGVALCRLNECEAYGNAQCGSDQSCNDLNMAPTSLGDWTCTCHAPGQGTKQGGKAVCGYDECVDLANLQICESAGQSCRDSVPLRESLNDWQCVCPQGSFAFKQPAECVLDECKEVCPTCANKGGGNVCAPSGQTCQDPDTSDRSTGDWLCICATGSPSAVANVAVCEVDECTMPGNHAAVTCDDVPRYSVDGCECQCNWRVTSGLVLASGPGADVPCAAGCCNPDRSAFGDWCIAADTPGNRANPKCALDTPLRCKSVATLSKVNACTKVPAGMVDQVCVDPDKSSVSTGDWRCECVAPTTGTPQLLGLAMCAEDECNKVVICADAGQLCKDASPAAGDWTCVCPFPATGTMNGAVATCDYSGECADAAIAAACSRVGQACYDPDAAVPGNWVCQCVSPMKGLSIRGAPALCTLDECTASCATCADKGSGNICAAAGQACKEGSTSPDEVGDWECMCPPGQVGQAVAAAAQCGVDECALNNGQFTTRCGFGGQACEDSNFNALGDWQCVCLPPRKGKATGVLADCFLDECLMTGPQAICAAAGQQCSDPNTNGLATDDWECVCFAADKSNVMAPANCDLPPQSWCSVHGSMCTEAGQICINLSMEPEVPGACACIEPLTGARVTGDVAVCALDECVAQCASCADSGNGNVCESNGQMCRDYNTHPVLGLRDWECVCPSGMGATAAVATCTTNECDLDVAAVCRRAEQTCLDPNTDADSLGDWFCVCPPPYTGKNGRAIAQCMYDECTANAGVCQGSGQMCVDPNTAAESMGDWLCECPPPSTGSRMAAAAMCQFEGECDDEAIAAVCTKRGQTCFDQDKATTGDWECRCVAPQTGAPGAQKAAECILDECKMSCPTCARQPGSRSHACVSAEQNCLDMDTDALSTGDWQCICIEPFVGTRIGQAAACSLDECADSGNRDTCEALKDAAGVPMQRCNDPDTAVSGDWLCLCLPPYQGAARAREAAVCTVDECNTAIAGQSGIEVCQAAGQECTDPSVSQLGNWLCRCVDGSANPNVQLAAPVPSALCLPPKGLCEVHATDCPSGQKCVESDMEWYCECILPAVGREKAGAAECTLNECHDRCPTCAQKGSVHTCAAQRQLCVDHNKAADSLNDWSCVCERGTGTAQGKVALCVLDECDLNSGVCTAAGQKCTDPDTTVDSAGDWLCLCELPASGFATAGAAECTADECLIHAETCTAVGQECQDNNQAASSLGDWVCKCPPPAKGYGFAAVATCTYTGGCDVEANQQVCAQAGQKCVSNGDPADWSCACIDPATGANVFQDRASCVLDECRYVCPTCAKTAASSAHVCESAGQGCRDPDTSSRSLSDWVCTCPAPSATAAVGKPADACEVDECAALVPNGARTCAHFQRFTTGGCQCACPWRVATNKPGFDGPGFSEPCVKGCCNPNKDPTGDWCMVADTLYNRGKAECAELIQKPSTCTDETAPDPAGAPALPSVNVAGSNILNTCTEAGQRCVDNSPTVSSLGDWECQCQDSASRRLVAVAECEVDECNRPQWASTEAPAQAVQSSAPATAGETSAPAATTSAPATGGAKDDCGNDQRYTDKGCQCSCPWKVVVSGGNPPPFSGPGFDTDCTAGCCNPDGASTTWCMLADNEWNRDRPACAAMIRQKQDCADTKPVGAPSRAANVLSALAGIPLNSKICTAAGQTCVDPDLTTDNDWECRCTGGAMGAMQGAPVAACTYEPDDECAVVANSETCSAANQFCFDPDSKTSGDWECRCLPPTVGSNMKNAPAECTLDECVTTCPSCADRGQGHACRSQGQTCADPDTSAAATSDWICTCEAPMTGSRVAKAAACLFDECEVAMNKNLCQGQEQECVDPDTTAASTRDWECRCLGEGVGKAVTAAARCVVDECLNAAKREVCGAAGQNVCVVQLFTCIHKHHPCYSALTRTRLSLP